MKKSAKKLYAAPKLEVFGTVTDLTQTGFTQPGDDGNFNANKGFEGSVCNPANPFGGACQ